MSSNQTDSSHSADARPVTAMPARNDKEVSAGAVFPDRLPEGQNDAETANRICESNQNSDGPLRGDDDLQRIKWVTPEVEKALNAHGVYTYDKLATYSAEKLSHMLSVYDLTVPKYKLEMIIEKSGEYAQGRRKRQPSQPAAGKSSSRAAKRQFEKHWRKDWAELANFFVSFGYEVTKDGEKQLQTRAIHYEGEAERQWKNIASSQLVEWMISLAKPSLPSEADAPGAVSPMPAAQSPSSAQTERAPLAVQDLQITEIRSSASNVPGYLAGRLRAEITVKLSDSLREFAENGIPYVAEAHLVNTQTRQSTMVASRANHLINDNFIYEIKLDFPLPAIGLYQSYVIARLLPPGEGTVQVKGPIINVEP
jgi:predicted flap endonuclease-1-like 5' DNA nuclease